VPVAAVDLNNRLGRQKKVHMALTDRRLLAIGDLVFLQPLGHLFLITGPLPATVAPAHEDPSYPAHQLPILGGEKGGEGRTSQKGFCGSSPRFGRRERGLTLEAVGFLPGRENFFDLGMGFS